LHSVICIPLRKTVIQDKVKEGTQPGEQDVQGVLYLDAHFLSGKLSSVSHDILRTIANGAATLVENAALVQSEDAAKRYRQELAIAAEIQQGLMKVTVPEVPFAKVNAVSYACKDIGGDFFDLVYTEGGLSLVVADVSGKGVSAAVVASILQGMLYSQLARDSALPEMIAAVNRFLCDKVGGQKYATLVIARLLGNGEMELINCGHVPPLLVSGDTITRLEEGNLPVGLVAGAEFQATRLQLKPGDRLLLVTDGVTEAEDAEGEFFGMERLEKCGKDGFAAIEQAVTNFRGDTALTDDCTITEMLYRGQA
jgi:serine phosphatase RsbU (regulator of sigma subunit)